MNIILFLLLLIPFVIFSKTVTVGDGGDYENLTLASQHVAKGDTIFVLPGNYPGDQWISGLKGDDQKMIYILAEPKTVSFVGSTEAWHLSDVEYLYISGFIFEGQTGNGVNIDDGGSYDTPSRGIVIENCSWYGMDATGNNDALKMSGVDYFFIRNCEFRNGAAGGSLIDMVGCHWGSIYGNKFENGGSNSIQVKGGSDNIIIYQNFFINGGARSINIGGSTGAEYFRPLDANYESAYIRVYSNVFIGSEAPVAYVGTVNSEVINNTIYLPDKWVFRILQENTDEGLLTCGNNKFWNNIVYLGNAASDPSVNIGPDTDPATFSFKNNLWFNNENYSWAGPNLPAEETNGLIKKNPLFLDESIYNFELYSQSPAIGAGLFVHQDFLDFTGKNFLNPPSIGAFEGGTPDFVLDSYSVRNNVELSVYPNPVNDKIKINFSLDKLSNVEIDLCDLLGNYAINLLEPAFLIGENSIEVDLSRFNAGIYCVILKIDGKCQARGMVVRN
jgi:hypothetical protein